jgi:Na+-driven multidrug efflux pump
MGTTARAGFAAVVLCVFFLAPRTLLGLLTSHDEVVEVCLRYAVWLVPTLMFGSLAIIYDGIFPGLTRGCTLGHAMILCSLGALVTIAPAGLDGTTSACCGRRWPASCSRAP